MRISVDGSRIRINKVAFSNLSGIVWTGLKFLSGLLSFLVFDKLIILGEKYFHFEIYFCCNFH